MCSLVLWPTSEIWFRLQFKSKAPGEAWGTIITHSLHCIFVQAIVTMVAVLKYCLRPSASHRPCQFVVCSFPVSSGAHPLSWWSLTGVETMYRPTSEDDGCPCSPAEDQGLCAGWYRLHRDKLYHLHVWGPCRCLDVHSHPRLLFSPHHLPLTAGAGAFCFFELFLMVGKGLTNMQATAAG